MLYVNIFGCACPCHHVCWRALNQSTCWFTDLADVIHSALCFLMRSWYVFYKLFQSSSNCSLFSPPPLLSTAPACVYCIWLRHMHVIGCDLEEGQWRLGVSVEIWTLSKAVGSNSPRVALQSLWVLCEHPKRYSIFLLRTPIKLWVLATFLGHKSSFRCVEESGAAGGEKVRSTSSVVVNIQCRLQLISK